MVEVGGRHTPAVVEEQPDEVQDSSSTSYYTHAIVKSSVEIPLVLKEVPFEGTVSPEAS